MALLDLKEKKDWDDFACKESVVVDSNGGIDSKETQVRRALRCLFPSCLMWPTSFAAASATRKAGGYRRE